MGSLRLRLVDLVLVASCWVVLKRLLFNGLGTVVVLSIVPRCPSEPGVASPIELFGLLVDGTGIILPNGLVPCS